MLLFFENYIKKIFWLPWQSQLSAGSPLNRILSTILVELHARNTLSFIQFGQVGKKMFKQMFDARWPLSVTIAHVDSLVHVS